MVLIRARRWNRSSLVRWASGVEANEVNSTITDRAGRSSRSVDMCVTRAANGAAKMVRVVKDNPETTDVQKAVENKPPVRSVDRTSAVVSPRSATALTTSTIASPIATTPNSAGAMSLARMTKIANWTPCRSASSSRLLAAALIARSVMSSEIHAPALACIGRAGTPATRLPGATSRVTQAPAATKAPSPIRTGRPSSVDDGGSRSDEHAVSHLDVSANGHTR